MAGTIRCLVTVKDGRIRWHSCAGLMRKDACRRGVFPPLAFVATPYCTYSVADDARLCNLRLLRAHAPAKQLRVVHLACLGQGAHLRLEVEAVPGGVYGTGHRGTTVSEKAWAVRHMLDQDKELNHCQGVAAPGQRQRQRGGHFAGPAHSTTCCTTEQLPYARTCGPPVP